MATIEKDETKFDEGKFDKAMRFEGAAGQPKINVGQTAASEWIAFTHWNIHIKLLARRSGGGTGSRWDIVYQGKIGEFPTIEYSTLDGSGWYASWRGDEFFHERGDHTASHQDKVIKYLGHNASEWYEASWDPRAKGFNVKRLK